LHTLIWRLTSPNIYIYIYIKDRYFLLISLFSLRVLTNKISPLYSSSLIYIYIYDRKKFMGKDKYREDSRKKKKETILHQENRPIFRATLSSKRTAPFCRLPLPTLLYGPEAAHLGDLMRLWVRTSTEMIFFEKKKISKKKSYMRLMIIYIYISSFFSIFFFSFFLFILSPPHGFQGTITTHDRKTKSVPASHDQIPFSSWTDSRHPKFPSSNYIWDDDLAKVTLFFHIYVVYIKKMGFETRKADRRIVFAKKR